MEEKFYDRLYKIFRELYGGEDRSLDPYIEKLVKKIDLSPKEACQAMFTLMSDKASGFQQAAFLTALQMKGATIDEIASFAYILRKLSEPLRLKSLKAGTVIGDTCGTGGGTLETFNVSTTIMFILASSGMIIAKHGNRAITSKCGSADVLEELGINIHLGPKEVEECLSKIGIAFIFAPLFHKAFKNIQKVRKEIGIPTIFNILGPLVNPAFCLESGDFKISQILGVNQADLTGKIAEVLRLLNVKRAMVVYGFDAEGKNGMDELSTLGTTRVSELQENGEIKNYELEVREFGFKPAKSQDLIGGNPKENAKILVDILSGREKGPKRDLVLLNAAAGLYVGDKAKDFKEGIRLACESIDTGKALKKLEELREFTNK